MGCCVGVAVQSGGRGIVVRERWPKHGEMRLRSLLVLKVNDILFP